MLDALQRLSLLKETLNMLNILKRLDFISVQIIKVYKAFKIQNMFYNEIVIFI